MDAADMKVLRELRESRAKLIDTLRVILKARHCDQPGCTNRACVQAALAASALREAGEVP